MIKRSIWWEKKWGRDKICGITRTRLRPGKNSNGVSRVIHLNCKHSFYRTPLMKWIKMCPVDIPTCPICRKNILYL